MPTSPEGRVKKEIDKILKKYGVWYYKPVQMGMGVVGIPDYVCCIRGRFVVIEAKSEKGKLTLLQEHTMRAIIKAEGYYLVIKPENLAELEPIIRELVG